MERSLLDQATEAVRQSRQALCKYITANDVGETRSHQAGYHLPKAAGPALLGRPGRRGENMERLVRIRWQGAFETHSRLVYYGMKTRNEYRLTRFGRGFPFLDDAHIGDLLVLADMGGDAFAAFVLGADAEIEGFLAAVGVGAAWAGGLLKGAGDEAGSLAACMAAYVAQVGGHFPATRELAQQARRCHDAAHGLGPEAIRRQADAVLLGWLQAEFALFRALEARVYAPQLQAPFGTADALVAFANTVLNRRKSRAGASLEHHLAALFEAEGLAFESQAETEARKRADFIFPSAAAYQGSGGAGANLLFWAAKTTCKDRWRQILTEADRIPVKHLFTLQQGISGRQLGEMRRAGVVLVVPGPHLRMFPAAHRSEILTARQFMDLARVRSGAV